VKSSLLLRVSVLKTPCLEQCKWMIISHCWCWWSECKILIRNISSKLHGHAAVMNLPHTSFELPCQIFKMIFDSEQINRIATHFIPTLQNGRIFMDVHASSQDVLWLSYYVLCVLACSALRLCCAGGLLCHSYELNIRGNFACMWHSHVTAANLSLPI